MTEGYLETTNGRIWYAIYGENQAKVPILVVHGGPGFLSMPDGLEKLWEDRPVIFYDQLGCGKSDRAAGRDFYSVEHYVCELADVMAGLNLDNVYLMGFSWGCALICAYMISEKPQGVKGIMLCAPYLSSPAWDADQRRNIALMPPEIRKNIEECEAAGDYGDVYQEAMMAYYRKHLCILEPWPSILENAFPKLNPDVYNTMWGASEFTITGKLKDFDLTSRLKEIEEPVLLTCGDRDEAGVKTVKDFQQGFPNARMAVIPKASHLHQLERPDIFSVVINDFLREIDRDNQNKPAE